MALWWVLQVNWATYHEHVFEHLAEWVADEGEGTCV